LVAKNLIETCKMILKNNCDLYFVAKGKCNSNNGCQDFCFATPVKPGFICGCREGFTLGKDGKSCESMKNYVSPLTCKLGEFRCKKFPLCIPDR